MELARPLWQLLCLTSWYRRLRSEMAADDPAVRPLEVRAASAPRLLTVRSHSCDVVVPVHGGVNFVRDLLRSVERNTAPGTYRLVLVDDSADDATHEALRALVRERPWAQLERNPRNLGFVESCNRGIAAGAAPYVCLLNSDTLVTEGWLERLLRAAESDPTVAVVNPVSNQAVNLSVALPPGYDLERLARRLRGVARQELPDVTTAVGFCMLLRRRVLDWLGGFDPIFGTGYCEESDLCMRCTDAGLRVVVAPDAFVYHRGASSFHDWQPLYRRNRPIFDARWARQYERDYARFLRRNPLQYLRDALLRHSVPKDEWTDAVARDADSELLRRRRECLRSPAAVRRKQRAVAGESRPRTRLDPQQREVRYPTAAFLTSIPAIANALRITFLVGDTSTSGGMTSIVQLAREFLLHGATVNLATLTEELHPERSNLPLQPLVYPDRETLVRLFPPSDVVVATFWTTADDYLPALRRRYDPLTVYFIQDYEALFYAEDDAVTRARVAATYALAERRIVKSRWLQALVEQRHGLACEVVPLGLDLGVFRDDGRQRDAGRPRVLSVARPYERRRGFVELAAAFRELHRRRPDVELVLVGTAPRDMPDDVGFPYTHAGHLDDANQMAELVRSCDVLVDSSLYQAFGRPGLEAMACGTAAVLTAEGGVAEYARHEHNCLVVPPGDPEAILAATLRLLTDAPLRDRLRAAGGATAARFDHLREAERHLELYRDWLQQRREAAS